MKKNLAGYKDVYFENCGIWNKDTKLKVYDKYKDSGFEVVSACFTMGKARDFIGKNADKKERNKTDKRMQGCYSEDLLVALSALIAAQYMPETWLLFYTLFTLGCIFAAWIAYSIGRFSGRLIKSEDDSNKWGAKGN